MKLEGQGVLITGGASGLGLATAERLHTAGAHIVLADVSAEAGAAAAAKIGENAGSSRPTSPQRPMSATPWLTSTAHPCAPSSIALESRPARILGENGPHDLDHFRRVLDINVIGTFNALRLAAERMRNNQPIDDDRGVIVMTTSIAAFDGQIGQAAYSASKAAIHGLTLTAARDLAEHQIRVCSMTSIESGTGIT